jgi:hypothetical protein
MATVPLLSGVHPLFALIEYLQDLPDVAVNVTDRWVEVVVVASAGMMA